MATRRGTGAGWSSVDQEPEGCVPYLDTVSGTDAAQAYKRQVLTFLALQDGDHVLEVGCGTG